MDNNSKIAHNVYTAYDKKQNDKIVKLYQKTLAYTAKLKRKDFDSLTFDDLAVYDDLYNKLNKHIRDDIRIFDNKLIKQIYLKVKNVDQNIHELKLKKETLKMEFKSSNAIKETEQEIEKYKKTRKGLVHLKEIAEKELFLIKRQHDALKYFETCTKQKDKYLEKYYEICTKHAIKIIHNAFLLNLTNLTQTYKIDLLVSSQEFWDKYNFAL